jgi:aminoglycoside phosphotransferase (APT) family kinase protein
MKSVTKYQATQDQIRAAFKAAGIGEATEIKELSDGWYNSVFSAIDKNGKKYVIKIAPPKDARVLSYERNLMASEVKFYRLLNEKTAIKTPQIIYSDFTDKIIPTAYFIMDFLSGERLDKAKLNPAEKKKADEAAALILAEFHKIKGEGYGYEQAGLCKDWKDALTRMTQMLIDDAAAFGKKCKIGDKLLQYIDKFADALKGAPCVLVNFDLHAMNLFCERTKDGDIRVAVLDLERGFWGDPIGDFVTPEPLKILGKKNILGYYNTCADQKIIAGSENAEIRYNIMTAYLAAVAWAERFSRFKGAGKIFNSVYLIGTTASKLLAKQAFSALKRLSNGTR